MSFVVEKEFDYNGFKCVVVIQSLGHRCGYVGVPMSHLLYGCDYDHYVAINKSVIGDKYAKKVLGAIQCVCTSDDLISIERYFSVHGGITYAGGGQNSEYPIKSDLWWFGFDCAHWGDAKDYEAAKILFADNEDTLKNIESSELHQLSFPNKHNEIRTLEYVVDECKKLADQLVEFK